MVRHSMMLKQFKQLSPVFQILGDPIRQQIIVLLADRNKLNVSQITEALPLSRPAVSHHLKGLRQVGILGTEKKGTEHYYFLTLAKMVTEMKHLLQLVEHNCELQ